MLHVSDISYGNVKLLLIVSATFRDACAFEDKIVRFATLLRYANNTIM